MKKLVLLIASFAPVSAFAAVDVSTEIAALTTDGTAALTAVGGALVGLAVIAVVYKWAKGMIFG
ncbi:MAG: hypothetical protein GY880_24795 [Planctomycetaceae bacterium]|jgi:hypothetical protein|nr:hypothetical protein [Planctomycetota bacterium]MCP4777450.1 hypothetical protein [Planctomycetaceae bacterium]